MTDPVEKFQTVYPIVATKNGRCFVNVAMLPDALRSMRPNRDLANEAADCIEVMDKKIATLTAALVLYQIELRDAETRRNVRSFVSRIIANIDTVLTKLELREQKPKPETEEKGGA